MSRLARGVRRAGISFATPLVSDVLFDSVALVVAASAAGCACALVCSSCRPCADVG